MLFENSFPPLLPIIKDLQTTHFTTTRSRPYYSSINDLLIIIIGFSYSSYVVDPTQTTHFTTTTPPATWKDPVGPTR